MKSSALYALGVVVLAVEGLVIRPFTKRKTLVPAPISYSPAENWEGIDGDWNTFPLRIGDSQQVVRVLPSTTSQQVWAVDPRACLYATDKNGCAESRGGVFYTNKSTTWQEEGLFELYIEKNLNMTGTGLFGYDSVTLGYVGQGGPSLQHQIVGAFAVEDFWFGHFGLSPKTTNFTNLGDNVPSFLTTLKSQNLIPSVSWGYNPGAHYRLAKVPASLTLGGCDRNRFIHNNVTFPLSPDTDRDIVVNINGITTDLKPNATHSGPLDTGSLLESPIYAFIDSTVAEIWLPLSACKRFEKVFNLVWDHTTQLYLISDAQHTDLLNSNPNVTFTLSPAPTGGPTVQISFPYAAFDHTAKPPYRGLQANFRYFPLRRALNESQYTLGRTFLQEAYLTVDWERSNFSVSSMNWTANSPQHLVPIFSPKSPSDEVASPTQLAPTGLSTATIGGIATSVIVVVSIIAVLSILLYRSNRQRKAREAKAAALSSKVDDSEPKNDSKQNVVAPKAELDAGEDAARKVFEKDSFYNSQNEAVEAPDNVIFELPGDGPLEREADGRELSEKEAMRVREERYNGIDGAASSAANPTTPTNQSRPLQTGQSPISPVTPGTATTMTTHTDESAVISPISATQNHRSISDALGGSYNKRLVSGAEIEPVKESEGARVPPSKLTESDKIDRPEVGSSRKRFSWED